MSFTHGHKERVIDHIRREVVTIGMGLSVQQALDHIRTANADGNFIYFYVVDAEGRLVGVLQTRKLLTSPLDARVESIMSRHVITIPETDSLMEACERFVAHKLLAFPVVDAAGRLLGALDIGQFTEELVDIQQRAQTDSVFETLGLRLSEIRARSLWVVFRTRFPWLLATIASGTACALLVGLFEVTLARSLILAFFLTMVLGLGESVSMQTMAIAAHALRHRSPRWRWYVQTLRREVQRTFVVGLACALTVGCIAVAWKRELAPGLVIASGILLSLLMAAVLGVSIPSLLHRLRLDLRLAAGPITLALTDVLTITAYFSLAALVLGR